MTASATALKKETQFLDTVTVDYKNMAGDVIGSVKLAKEVFSLPPNIALLHQVVTAHLASRRSGTQSTKTRSEVKGGSAKPFRQKGTGNARQGTIRAPHYVGGGIALGPKPRSYDMKTPKKMIKQALFIALSDRAASDRVIVIDEWKFAVPKTKDALGALDNLGADGKILLVITRDADTVVRSFANLANVVTIPRDQLTAYDVLGCDYVIFTKDTLAGDCEITETPVAKKATTSKTAAAKKPRATKAAAKVEADEDVEDIKDDSAEEVTFDAEDLTQSADEDK